MSAIWRLLPTWFSSSISYFCFYLDSLNRSLAPLPMREHLQFLDRKRVGARTKSHLKLMVISNFDCGFCSLRLMELPFRTQILFRIFIPMRGFLLKIFEGNSVTFYALNRGGWLSLAMEPKLFPLIGRSVDLENKREVPPHPALIQKTTGIELLKVKVS